MRLACVIAAALLLPGCSTADTSQEAEAAGGEGIGTGGDNGAGSTGGAVSTAPQDGETDGIDTQAGSDGLSDDGSDDEPPADDTGDPGTGGRRDVWTPAPGTTWQWQLTETVDTSLDVEVYDIDLFDVTADVIETLHNDGRTVICYFSAGSYEEWRLDAALFPREALGNPLDGWPGERWLDHRNPTVRQIMEARLDLAVTKQCDAVEPDNVDGYANDHGAGISADDQLDYNGWLATQAHARGLSIGLKNDVDQLEALADAFDWALNEECVQYEECGGLEAAFIDQGKAVFHVEYVDDLADGEGLAELICGNANQLGFSTLVKEWDLGVWGIPCW